MKLSKFILTGILATTMIGASFASNTIEEANSITLFENHQAPREIKVGELPKAVQEVLKANKYKIEKAYVLQIDGEIVYRVEANKEEEKITLTFDEEGNEIREE